MKVLIISCSLNPNSRSFILATQAITDLEKLGVSTQLLDLREHPLELAGSSSSWGTPNAKMLSSAIRDADAILMAVPIYNFYANAVAKNVIEVTGSVWNNKLVGFLCAAGGNASYMSVMNLANSLMLDFRCLIIPRFVYACKSDFSDGTKDQVNISSTEIKSRIKELTATTVELATALKGTLTKTSG